MSMYDPGWHRFEPTREEVLVDAQREERAQREARGLRRLLRRLPWPLRVVLPFAVAVSLPILGLALAFGAASGDKAPPSGIGPELSRQPPAVPLRVETSGSIAVEDTLVQFISPPIYGIDKIPYDMKATVWMRNQTDADLFVTVSVTNEAAAGVKAAYPLAAQLVSPGPAKIVTLLIRRTRPVDLVQQPLIVTLTQVAAP